MERHQKIFLFLCFSVYVSYLYQQLNAFLFSSSFLISHSFLSCFSPIFSHCLLSFSIHIHLLSSSHRFNVLPMLSIVPYPYHDEMRISIPLFFLQYGPLSYSYFLYALCGTSHYEKRSDAYAKLGSIACSLRCLDERCYACLADRKSFENANKRRFRSAHPSTPPDL